jgi:two-component system NtrC family sensor kinase
MRYFNKNTLNLKEFIKNLKIVQKIGYGYSLAIGLAILGTMVGLIIGDYYETQAKNKLILADQQLKIIYNLKSEILEMYYHPQKLANVLADSIWFQYETSKYMTEVKKVVQLFDELDAFIENNPNHLNFNSDEIKKLIQKGKELTTSYTKFMQFLWQQTQPMNLDSDNLLVAKEKLFNSMAGQQAKELRVKHEKLSEGLTRLTQAAETQQAQANEELTKAVILRLQIIVSSMIVSVVVTAILAIYTSQAIARPIVKVTAVARQVTKNSNFQLQAPVLTNDEVGILAMSLNQLIVWVGKYTDELRLAKTTLENRVEERTAELKSALEHLKETQTQLIQTEKMSSLGQMVAGIAHEINNPVNFIHGNLTHIDDYTQDLLEFIELVKTHPSESELEEFIEEIDLDFIQSDLPQLMRSMKVGTERIKSIVLSLRTFSRLDEADLKEADIHAGLEDTLLILNHRIKNGIEVIKQYGKLPLLDCYPAQLNQVFMNLISNAIDSMESHPTEQQPQLIIATELINPDLVQIKIKDNGGGIPLEIQEKIFDPFFTTKPIGKGTGLGLSISYGIIEKHQGQINVKSEMGKGTEFVITIPT